MTQHTATPWRASVRGSSICSADKLGHDIEIWLKDGGYKIATVHSVVAAYPVPHPVGQANAEFIVRACNSHEQLVAALELANRYLYKASADGMQTVVPVARAITVVEAALAAAKGVK